MKFQNIFKMLSPTFVSAPHSFSQIYDPCSGQYVNINSFSALNMSVPTMKAVRVHRFGGPEVLSLEQHVPIPPLKENQVLVRVLFAGVNPVETYIREGQYSRLPELPYTPGSDAAGYVHQVGNAVTSLKVGDRVFVAGTSSNTGSYAQFVVSDDTYVFPLHERLSFAQGASLGVPFFTAYKALILRAQTKPGEVVLIHGASGAVGTAAVQIARAMGTTVVGTAGTKEGMDVVSRCGAHHVFNHNHKSYEKKMVEHLGTGFDVIIEHLANINLGHDLQMLKPSARVMVVGCRGAVNINPRHLMLPEASIRGVALGTSTPAEWSEMGAAIVAGIEAGWVNPVINQEYTMDEVQQVHHDIIHSKGAKGKLVIRVVDE
ncbi:quinone oxidoreductase-like [Eurytemora carolleeae]|uniref:quinone oxidoreductase-like n=1 Tax=Eurytemora carolleeae TaxID=1294199 RepID=UPI000C7597C9|nr:quinone oxidoreductase-like [Eurytemora carolleeae]|eukprot:XP_023330212.1 quinone oxidoreductase-like [Eurytemora affinis]